MGLLTIRDVMVVVLAATLIEIAVSEKKIELEDIEEDNLRSEQEKALQKQSGSNKEATETKNNEIIGPTAFDQQIDYLKSGMIQVYGSPLEGLAYPRHSQYAVTESPDQYISRDVTAGIQTNSENSPQNVIGVMQPIPVQILYVPQYYPNVIRNDSPQTSINYVLQPNLNSDSYLTAKNIPDNVNYNYPSFIAQDASGYLPPLTKYYTQKLNFISPHIPATEQPILHSVPSDISLGSNSHNTPSSSIMYNSYHSQNANQNGKQEHISEHYEDYAPKPLFEKNIPLMKQHDSEKQYFSPAAKHNVGSSPRYPLYNNIRELPPPSPLLFQNYPSNTYGIPKVLSYFNRPMVRPVYSHISGNLGQPNSQASALKYYGMKFNGFNGNQFRPYHKVAANSKYRPASLLDSYVPSSLQLEYLKNGKDPLLTYEAILNSQRQEAFRSPRVLPKHYERGFLPNQVYHTGSGGLAFGKYKRDYVIDKTNCH